MARTSCLAGIDEEKIALLRAALVDAGAPALASIARLSVVGLGKLGPGILLCDIDELVTDRLELLRQVRFVLPECIIAVYTGVISQRWALACHLAGANCLLDKTATETQLAAGLRSAFGTGCYTGPSFAAN